MYKWPGFIPGPFCFSSFFKYFGNPILTISNEPSTEKSHTDGYRMSYCNLLQWAAGNYQ